VSPDERRDEVVAAALRSIEVPDHRPGFWDDLDRAVAGDAGHGEPGEPVEPVDPGQPAEWEPSTAATAAPAAARVDTGQLPSVRSLAHERHRRRSRAPWLAVAAAVVALVAAVGIVALGDDGDPGDDLAGEPTDSSTASTTGTSREATTATSETTATTAATTTTAATVGGATAGSPEEAVRSWIDELGSGDLAAAAARLGPRTLRYLGEVGADPVGYMAESQEGLGGWAGAPDLRVVAATVGPVELLGPGAQLAIVTVEGTHPGEGAAQYRVDAIPVVNDGSQWVVEHLAHAGDRENRVVFTVPPMGEDGTLGGMNAGDEVNVFVPSPGTVYFQVDGGEVVADTTSPVGRYDEPFALYDPPGDLGPGTHRITVVAVGDDGTITAYGGTFVVET
jgi:hypothetical protein